MSTANEHVSNVAELVMLRFLTSDGTEIFGPSGAVLRDGTRGDTVGSLTAFARADSSAFCLRLSIAAPVTLRVGLRSEGGRFLAERCIGHTE